MVHSPIVRIQKNCPLCYSVRTKPVLSERHDFAGDLPAILKQFDGTWAQLLECKECGFAFAKEIPTDKGFFEKRYDYDFLDPEQEHASVRKNQIIEKAFDLAAKAGVYSGKILDVGSFAGVLLREGVKRGFAPNGIEVNSKLASYSRDVLGHSIICSEFLNCDLPRNEFDLVTIIDVLEHLDQPREVLTHIGRSLKPGGILVIKVPNYRMQKFKQSLRQRLRISHLGIFSGFSHINQFSPFSMRKVLDALGFEYLGHTIARSETWHYKGLKYRVFNIFRSFFFYLSRVVSMIPGVNLGFNLFYVARKK